MAKSNMDQDILKVLYSEEQLKTRVQEMGDELYERLNGQKSPVSRRAEGLLHLHGRHRARLPAQERH